MARSSQFPPSVNSGIPKEQKPPIGWKLVQFGKVLRVVERPAKLLDEHEYQLVTAKRNRGGIIPREKLIGIKILTKNQYFLVSGDFLISRRQIVHGACGIVPKSLEGAIASNEYATLLPNNNILLEYLSYYSHTPHFQQTCFHSSIGVDVEKMVFKIDDWLQHKMLLPPISEQQKMCAILSSVDDAIQATQAVIDQTRMVKQGLMQQLLTRGIGHTQFKQTEIGEIPEGWAIVKLGDVANESKERFIPNGNEIYTYVGLEHMKSGINRIARTGLSSDVTSSKTVFKVGDTLFGKLRPYLKKVALSDILGVCSTDIIAIRPSEQIDPYFLCAVLSSDSAISHSIESSAGTKMPRTSWKEMSNFNVLLPKIIEQKKIAAVLKSLDEVLQIEQTKLQQNIKIKRGLMQDLLTGRVRVKLEGEGAT